METTLLTEAEFHDFIDRLDTFALGLTPQARQFLTLILLRACTSQASDVLNQAGHAGSMLHAHLAYAVWQSTRDDASLMVPNPLPFPRDEEAVGGPRAADRTR